MLAGHCVGDIRFFYGCGAEIICAPGKGASVSTGTQLSSSSSRLKVSTSTSSFGRRCWALEVLSVTAVLEVEVSAVAAAPGGGKSTGLTGAMNPMKFLMPDAACLPACHTRMSLHQPECVTCDMSHTNVTPPFATHTITQRTISDKPYIFVTQLVT